MKSPFNIFKNELSTLSALLTTNPEKISHIEIDVHEMARKIERFYQVEKLLRLYCKSEVAIYEQKIPENYDIMVDREVVLDNINLKEYKTNYIEYYLTIMSANQEEAEKANANYEARVANSPEKEVLGLKRLVLRGTPTSLYAKNSVKHFSGR